MDLTEFLIKQVGESYFPEAIHAKMQMVVGQEAEDDTTAAEEGAIVIPPGWETVYLWTDSKVWIQQNYNQLFGMAGVFLGMRLLDLGIAGYFGYSLYTSYIAYS